MFVFFQLTCLQQSCSKKNDVCVDQKGVKYLDVNPVLPEDDKEIEAQIVNMKLSLYLNSAQACLKQGTAAAARQAIQYCTKALNLDRKLSPTHLPGELHKDLTPEEKAKSYFRRGSAYLTVQDFDLATKDLAEASALQPGDAGIKQTLASAKKQADAQKAKEKARLAKMFA